MSTPLHMQEETQGSWWQLLKNALGGRGGDPTRGPIVPAIVSLAIPMVLEMLMESLFAIVNIFFVSRLGASAAAAIGLTESLLAIIYTVAMGLSIGVMAVVARRSVRAIRMALPMPRSRALLSPSSFRACSESSAASMPTTCFA